ncbi:hypothetical protein [Flavihumibacter sp. CACIAM 22H1]|uniref:hypothetical protein n=1 Tax=Flavihumibacter sp. CACIAM 22H1 TaxID=1812911 RepID=UPI0007A80CB6|nr:hypothetical protein [Flavihumibacter sp. CACIAM 22H1]KYP15856.1 MAG: hypothetical protein A1D16_10575 [Flavihumibacter sp. CACIAM 22H1]
MLFGHEQDDVDTLSSIPSEAIRGYFARLLLFGYRFAILWVMWKGGRGELEVEDGSNYYQ